MERDGPAKAFGAPEGDATPLHVALARTGVRSARSGADALLGLFQGFFVADLLRATVCAVRPFEVQAGGSERRVRRLADECLRSLATQPLRDDRPGGMRLASKIRARLLGFESPDAARAYRHVERLAPALASLVRVGAERIRAEVEVDLLGVRPVIRVEGDFAIPGPRGAGGSAAAAPGWRENAVVRALEASGAEAAPVPASARLLRALEGRKIPRLSVSGAEASIRSLADRGPRTSLARIADALASPLAALVPWPAAHRACHGVVVVGDAGPSRATSGEIVALRGEGASGAGLDDEERAVLAHLVARTRARAEEEFASASDSSDVGLAAVRAFVRDRRDLRAALPAIAPATPGIATATRFLHHVASLVGRERRLRREILWHP